MEGPSLALAAEQLQPFAGLVVQDVRGNARIDRERFRGQRLSAVFNHGKQLFMQFPGFALRTHFLLYGTYEAEVEGVQVSGDYVRTREPRLVLRFANGEVRMFNCSLRIVEQADVAATLDFRTDVLSKHWSTPKAMKALSHMGDEEISDVLLDQDVFAGVGNIIKNEVLYPERLRPQAKVRNISLARRRTLIRQVLSFSRLFLKWRRKFELRKHLQVHGRSTCPNCGGKLVHPHTGKRHRRAHYCPRCQKLTARKAAVPVHTVEH
jgi:endonuclease-8